MTLLCLSAPAKWRQAVLTKLHLLSEKDNFTFLEELSKISLLLTLSLRTRPPPPPQQCLLCRNCFIEYLCNL